MTTETYTEPRAVVRLTKSSQTGKEGFEVSYEHSDPDTALKEALRLRAECRAALEGPSLSDQLAASIEKETK